MQRNWKKKNKVKYYERNKSKQTLYGQLDYCLENSEYKKSVLLHMKCM